MPRRSGVLGPPNRYLLAHGSWPTGPFRKDTPDTVKVAAVIAARLQGAVEKSGKNVKEISEGLGIARSTYYDIINGTTLPDLHTLVRAEKFLQIELWPRPDGASLGH